MRCKHRNHMRDAFMAIAACALVAGAIALTGCAGGGASSAAAGLADAGSASAAAASVETSSASAAPVTSYEVDYGKSELYTQVDIDAAVDTVMAEFSTWKGCQMKSISFTDDATCKADVAYCNELRENGDAKYDQAMVLTSSFHSPSGADAEGTAWEPDTDYNDYTWHLARANDGNWDLLTWGYA